MYDAAAYVPSRGALGSIYVAGWGLLHRSPHPACTQDISLFPPPLCLVRPPHPGPRSLAKVSMRSTRPSTSMDRKVGGRHSPGCRLSGCAPWGYCVQYQAVPSNCAWGLLLRQASHARSRNTNGRTCGECTQTQCTRLSEANVRQHTAVPCSKASPGPGERVCAAMAHASTGQPPQKLQAQLAAREILAGEQVRMNTEILSCPEDCRQDLGRVH